MDVRTGLIGTGSDADPYPAYARLREERPVCRVRLRDDVHCWVVSRYEDARSAFADPRLSRDPRVAGPAWREADRGRPLEDGAGLGVHLLTREPPDHERLRRLVSAVFTKARTEALRERVEQVADSLIDAFEERGEAELIAEFAYPLPITVICEILGIPAEDRSLFRQWTSNAVAAESGDVDGRLNGVQPPGEYLRALVAAKRDAPGDDLISALVADQGQGRLSESELLSMIFLLVIAGHENTAGLIGNGVVALLRSPGQLALLRERPELADAVVEEVLRYDGPMELAAWRWTTEAVEIGGTLIPAGEPVLIALAGAHRDPARFTEPDRFDVERPDNAHLGFGHGRHHCLGAPLGRLEGAVGLRALVRRLPDLALAVPQERLRRQPSSIVRALHELPVVFTPVRGPGEAAGPPARRR
ncbi:cytochrome P450 family protein [Actinomadura litoris]|uniref:cytochrome P450 family protein n=1 Tax=Actinomadura litoris TaxID=2678616 RepID=UPI001FA80478|nr:cytochrome P450 [Actinomadura litoris]